MVGEIKEMTQKKMKMMVIIMEGKELDVNSNEIKINYYYISIDLI